MNRFGLVIPALLATSVAACNRDGPALYPVTGSVVYKGQPATGATVILRRDAGESFSTAADLPLATGQVNDQGRFTLSSGDLGAGAPVGQYKVMIQWRTRDQPPQLNPGVSKAKPRVVADKPDGMPDILKGRYMLADVTKLHAEIKPEANELPPFDVSK